MACLLRDLITCVLVQHRFFFITNIIYSFDTFLLLKTLKIQLQIEENLRQIISDNIQLHLTKLMNKYLE